MGQPRQEGDSHCKGQQSQYPVHQFLLVAAVGVYSKIVDDFPENDRVNQFKDLRNGCQSH